MEKKSIKKQICRRYFLSFSCSGSNNNNNDKKTFYYQITFKCKCFKEKPASKPKAAVVSNNTESKMNDSNLRREM